MQGNYWQTWICFSSLTKVIIDHRELQEEVEQQLGGSLGMKR